MPREIFRDEESKEYTLETLISEQEIQKIVRRLGRNISKDYHDKSLLAVGVLNGAHMFLSDLERQIIGMNPIIDFIRVSSYGNGTDSNGMPRIEEDLKTNPKGKDLLLVEDIVDTGYSLTALLNFFELRGVNSVETTALLSKPSRRKINVPVKYIGKQIPDKFVVGYGLDYGEIHRNLRAIYEVKFI